MSAGSRAQGQIGGPKEKKGRQNGKLGQEAEAGPELSIPETGRGGLERSGSGGGAEKTAGDTLGLSLPWRVAGRQKIAGSGSHVARAKGSMAGMHRNPASIPRDSQEGISSPEVMATREAWPPPWKKGPAGAPGAGQPE